MSDALDPRLVPGFSSAGGLLSGPGAELPGFAGSVPGALSGAPAEPPELAPEDPARAFSVSELAPNDPARAFSVSDLARYELRGVLGEGGMGRVELAFDRRLGREVALKTPKRPGDLRRLAREAWITARLDHPAIVPIYEAGRRPDGTPYYAMRVFRGRNLEQALAACGTLAERLRYLPHVLTATQGVAHAHAQGIAHGDLKPENLLVGDLGVAQVADWGLAGPDVGEVAAVGPQGPVGGTPAGTPGYMSPERQAGGAPDLRSDVWALGALLRRLAQGAAPRGGAPAPTPPEEAPAELQAIIVKAMDPLPSRRYPDARALAADLGDWLEGRRVAAHVYTPTQLLLRLLRAWRGRLVVAASFLLVLAALGAVAVRRVVAERGRARAAEQAAQDAWADALLQRARDQAKAGLWHQAQRLATESLQLGALWGVPLEASRTPELRGLLMATARPHPTGEALALSPGPLRALAAGAGPGDAQRLVVDAQGAGLWDAGALRWRRPELNAERVALAQFDGAGGVALLGKDYRLHRLALADGRDTRPPAPLEGGHTLSAGRGWVLVAWGDRVQAVPAGAEPLPNAPACLAQRAVRALVVGERRSLLAGCDDGRVMRSDDGQGWVERARLPPDDMALRAALSADEAAALLLNERGVLTVLDWATGAPRLRRETALRGPTGVAVSPSGRWLAAATLRDGAWLLSAETGAVVERLPAHGPLVAWAGEALLLQGAGAAVVRWTLPQAVVAPVLGGPGEAGVSALAALSGGGAFVGRGDGTLHRYAADGRVLWAQRVGDQTLKDLSLSPDEQVLYVARVGGPTVALRVAGERAPSALAPPAGALQHRRVAALADGRVVVAGWRNTAGLYDGTGNPLAPEERAHVPPRFPVSDLDRTPGAAEAVLIDESGAVLLTTPRGFRPLARVAGARAVAADRDGYWVVTDAAAQRIGADGSVGPAFPVPSGTLDALVPAAGLLALSGPEGAALYQIAGLVPGGHPGVVASLRGHDERVSRLAGSDDALLTGSWDGGVRRWGWAGLGDRLPALLADAAGWGRLGEP